MADAAVSPGDVLVPAISTLDCAEHPTPMGQIPPSQRGLVRALAETTVRLYCIELLLPGHSMVLEPASHTLLILAGQRDERYLSDMYAYHIPTGTVTELFSNFTTAGGPDPCFTQRAVIDPELREIYL